MISGLCARAALMLVLGGCSLFMRGPDPAWNGGQEPDCSDSYAPVFIDGLTAVSIAGGLREIAEDGAPLDDRLVLIGILTSVFYTASAGVGASRYKECRFARAQWHADEAIRAARSNRNAEPSTTPLAMASPAAPGAVSDPSPAVPLHAGYFCTRSPRPVRQVCLRDRGACQRIQQLLGEPDVDCMPRDVVWCFQIADRARCFTARDACDAQQMTAGAASTACAELR